MVIVRYRLRRTLRYDFLFALITTCATGCVSMNPEAKVKEAIDLVEQRVGDRPAWSAPWDELPPAWDGQTVLGVDEAVVLALRNNRELRADLEMIGKANADLVQAGLMQNPVINFMAGFPDGGGRAMLRSNALPLQSLQNLWLIPARKKVATAQLQQAVLRVADRAVETAAAAKRVYARLQYTQRAIELIKENMAVVDNSTQLVQIRLTVGKATQVEVNVPRIRFLRLQSELMAMEAEQRNLKRELLMQMGFAAGMDTWSVEPIHELSDALEPALSEEDLIAAAQTQRLDLQAAEWELAASERRIELMHREGWPELAVGFTFERAPAPRSQNPTLAGRAGNSAAQALTGATPEAPKVMPFSPKPREVKYLMGPMIEMELPIFDRNQAQVAKAIHEYNENLAKYEARGQDIVWKVRETRVTYDQACEQVRFFRDAIIPEVERNLKLVQQSYLSGQEDYTIYLQVQEDIIMNRLRVLEFLRDVKVNLAELERQVGGRLPRPEAALPSADAEAPNSGTDRRADQGENR